MTGAGVCSVAEALGDPGMGAAEPERGRKRGDTFQETEGVKRNFRRSAICSAYARGQRH